MSLSTLVFPLDVQNASGADHRMDHSLVKENSLLRFNFHLLGPLQKRFWHPHDEPFLNLQVYSINHSAAKHWLADLLVSFGNMKRELFENWLFLSYS